MADCSCISSSAPAALAAASSNAMDSLRNQCGNGVAGVSDLRNISAIETVAQTSEVAQVARIGGIGLDFPAQVGNMVIDDTIGGIGIRPPRCGEQAFAAEHAAARVNEGGEQFEFERRQLDRLSLAPQLATLEIDLDFAEGVAIGLVFAAGAAQQSFHAGSELAGAEGLGHVIVGSEFEAHHYLRLLRLGGQHENGSAQAVAPELAADFKTILSGKHDVEQNQIEGTFARAAGGNQAVGDRLDFVALHAEVVFQAKSDAGLVLNYQDAGHACPASGSSMVNVLPCPGSLATRIAPPWAATMCRTMASPTPEPFTLAAAAALPRTNFRNILFCSDAVIPGPSSRTRMAT